MKSLEDGHRNWTSLAQWNCYEWMFRNSADAVKSWMEDPTGQISVVVAYGEVDQVVVVYNLYFHRLSTDFVFDFRIPHISDYIH